MELSSMILMLVVGAVLTGLFWKLDWLKIVTTKNWDMGDVFKYDMLSKGSSDGGLGGSESGQTKGKAVLEVRGFLKFEIPEWMGDPPINYAICFLIICSGLSMILFTYGTFIG